ncbi:MAG: glycosyltransferase [Lachnospiraceae bacterium]|nr:glycosyltransferase [Lachnospiraceae bacterium]
MKKKVLQISKYYFPFIGGTEQVARDIANALKPCDEIEQKIFCFNEDASAGGITTKKNETVVETVDGVEVIRCGYVAKISSQSISTTVPVQLKIVMDEFKPDIIILHYPNPYVTHYLLKYKERNFKLVIYWHLDITKQKVLKHLFHHQNLELIKRADRIIGATPKHIDESFYTPQFGSKREILPYAIDEERLKISEEEKAQATQIRQKYAGKVLGFFIGRHVPYKGLAYLIEASKYVPDDFHFIIAGSGELTEELKAKAAGDCKVEFVGRINDSEWRSYLWACDIFCFPSVTRNEGFGLALAEGMYYGKPAVTFTISGSGVNYVNLDGVTGIECPNRDSKAYADALVKLGNDKALREKYGNQARQRVLDNFTFERFQNNVVKLVESLT